MEVGEYVKSKRKKMSMTQIELAQGICNQGTISQLENKNKIPSVVIINKICKKLNIIPQELMKLIENENSYNNETILKKVRLYIYSKRFVAAEKEIKKIDKNDNNFTSIENNYYLYKGILCYRANQIEEAVFFINLALQKNNNKKDKFTELLSKIYLGIIYFDENEISKAKIYMEDSKDLIESINFDKIKDMEIINQVSWITYNIANFYSKINEVQIAVNLAEKGLKIVKSSNIVVNAEYLYYILAYNEERNQVFNANMSYYLSCFNSNKYLEEKILTNFESLIK